MQTPTIPNPTYKETIDTALAGGQITPFQYSLLSSINFFETSSGKYYYNKIAIEAQFKDHLKPKQIQAEVDNLIKNGWIKKDKKTILWNGKFSTRIIFTTLAPFCG